ncbi:hypothetical protein C8R44DRAFT_981457 [Mycena epipterygia]|nr:hypothetical protein C8R44DRAFT_981457 [Mycena epipterygia]
MHRSLRNSVLTGLPSAIRKTARAAVNGSLDHLMDIQAQLQNGMPDAQATLLLPVFYVNLDPLDVPTADDLDVRVGPTSRVRTVIHKAVIALRGLYAVREIPIEACENLWPRLWQWLRFLHTFHEQLTWLDEPPSEQRICIDLLVFLGSFQHNRRAAALFSATPGFRFMMGRAWFFLLQFEDLIPGLIHISRFLIEDMKADDPRNLEELMEGTGGSLEHLGWLVVQHINRVIPTWDTPVSATVEYLLRGVLSMLGDTERETMTTSRTRIVLCPLTAALIPQGAVRALTKVTCALSRSTATGADFTLNKCFITLGRILTSPLGYKLLPDALEAGLLIALVSAGARETSDKIYGHLVYLITGTLRVSLVYYNVLAKLDAALLEVEHLEQDDKFTNAKIFPEWIRVRELADERLAIFHAAENVPTRACDNLQCGRIDEKNHFKRCSGCQSAYYCSEDCQIHDWRHENHRQNCDPRRSFCLNENTSLTSRERMFLRKLIHHDYGQHPAMHIYMPEITFMNRHPDTAFFTRFDYTTGHVTITVNAVADAKNMALDPQWLEDVSRAARSGGRMRLHVMLVAEADVPRYWLVPLRSDTPRLHDGLKRIATNLPTDQEAWDMLEIVHDIQALMDNGSEPGIEIH